MADVTGDGRADVVGFGNEGTYVAASDGQNFGPTTLWAADFGANQGWRKMGLLSPVEGSSDVYIGAHHIRTTADVNGDGRADIVGFGDNGVYFALSTGNRFTGTRLAVADFGYQQGWTVWQSPYDNTTGMRPSSRVRLMADVTGDRKADIVAFGADGVYVATSRGINFNPPQRAVTIFGEDTHWNGTHVRTVADVNGDGRADLVGIYDNGAYTALANGSGGFTLTPGYTFTGFGCDTGWTTPENYPRVFPDLNGDHRADFVGFGNDGVWTALSQGSYTMTTPVLSINGFGYNAGNWRPLNTRFTPDINGDGRADVAGFSNTCVAISITQTQPVVAQPPGLTMPNRR